MQAGVATPPKFAFSTLLPTTVAELRDDGLAILLESNRRYTPVPS